MSYVIDNDEIFIALSTVQASGTYMHTQSMVQHHHLEGAVAREGEPGTRACRTACSRGEAAVDDVHVAVGVEEEEQVLGRAVASARGGSARTRRQPSRRVVDAG